MKTNLLPILSNQRLYLLTRLSRFQGNEAERFKTFEKLQLDIVDISNIGVGSSSIFYNNISYKLKDQILWRVLATNVLHVSIVKEISQTFL